MVQGFQCFPWPRRQSSPSLQEENMKELVLRRSASERKLAKEKKKERKEKALSVHFGEKTLPGMADISVFLVSTSPVSL